MNISEFVKNAPNIEIDLSLSVEERYKNILNKFDLNEIVKVIESIYDEYSSYFSVFNYYLNCNNQYWDELTYLSKILGISQYKLYTFGVILDNTNTTSSISQIFNDKKYLIKSFEFNSKFDIKPLIFKTVYTQNGTKQYETVNIFGSIGFYNLKNCIHNYNISFSSRIADKSFTYRTLTTSLLLRNIAENNLSFDQSLEVLCKTTILQPVYFLTFKYNQKFSFVIQRDICSHQIIKKETVIVTDTDEQTFLPNINFSVSRYHNIEKNSELQLEKFIKKFISFPIIRHSTQFILIQNENESILKLV